MSISENYNSSQKQTLPINESVIKYRLGTEDLLIELDRNLRGIEERPISDQEGNIIYISVQTGIAKANDLGIQTLKSRFRNIINSAVVQGNYTEKRYTYEISSIRKSIAKTLILNLYRYEIDENEITNIIDSFMECIKPFLSRLIDNKERESLSQSTKIIESNQQKSSGMNLFN